MLAVWLLADEAEYINDQGHTSSCRPTSSTLNFYYQIVELAAAGLSCLISIRSLNFMPASLCTFSFGWCQGKDFGIFHQCNWHYNAKPFGFHLNIWEFERLKEWACQSAAASVKIKWNIKWQPWTDITTSAPIGPNTLNLDFTGSYWPIIEIWWLINLIGNWIFISSKNNQILYFYLISVKDPSIECGLER